MELDTELFLLLQQFTGNRFLDLTYLVLAESLVFLVPLTLVYLWFKSEKGRKDSVFVFIATVLGISITYLLGIFYFHNQPFASYETIVAAGELDNAFPSQHTATMFSCFWSFLYLERKNLSALFGVGGAVTGICRVLVGLHYPLDILGGILSGLMGLGAAIIVYKFIGDEIEVLTSYSYRIQNRIFG